MGKDDIVPSKDFEAETEPTDEHAGTQPVKEYGARDLIMQRREMGNAIREITRICIEFARYFLETEPPDSAEKLAKVAPLFLRLSIVLHGAQGMISDIRSILEDE